MVCLGFELWVTVVEGLMVQDNPPSNGSPTITVSFVNVKFTINFSQFNDK